MNRITTVLLALSILFACRANAQYFQSNTFKEGSGLPSSETYLVFEDSKGFLWIATDNGVVKYDGHEFVTYNTAHGLLDNTVFGFTEDSKGRIWFRTYNSALCYYEDDTIKGYKYNRQLKESVNTAILSSLQVDSTGSVFFSTYNLALGKIDSLGTFTKLIERRGDESFMGFVGNEPLFGTSGMPRELRTIRIGDKSFPVSPDDAVNQNKWMATSVRWKGKDYFTIHKNIFSYDGKNLVKEFTAASSILSLYVDHMDGLWVGYFNKGVDLFNDPSFGNPSSFTELDGLSVSSVIQDYEEGIWISTLDQGIYYFPNLSIQNYLMPNSTRVSAIACRDDDIYLGNYSGEVYKMKADGSATLLTNAVAPVSYLFLDNTNKLWISDGAGTHIHETGKYIGGRGNQAKSFKALVHSGNDVIGYNSMGVFKLSPNGDILQSKDIRRRPSSIAITNRHVYLGGLNGLEKLPMDFNGEAFSLCDVRIASVMTLNERYLALGTISRGLFIVDTNSDKLIPVSVGDAVNMYSIVSDWHQQKMWVGTDRGLFQLNFVNDTTLRSYSKANSLISNKITGIYKIEDSIWAVSDLGISLVPFSHFGEQAIAPKFYIRQIMFKNRSVNASDDVIMTEENNMVVEVRTITFKGHQNNFRYRLNHDEDWKVISGGSIFLTNLQPERYTLEVQASVGDNEWTRAQVLQIDVVARWWETWMFRIVAAIALLALGYLTYWLRISAIRRRQKYLELINLHQQKLIDSEIRTQERERKRIASDLHDGIGTSLSSIKLQITDAMEEADKTRVQEINDHLTDVIDDIKRIVYDLHPPALERYGLHSGLKGLVDRINKSTDVNVIFDYYGQSDIVQPVSITIFRILQELINNTLKHARASEIRIHINEFDDEINIMYEDNGIGMIGSRFTGLGLHSIESRVRSLNGRMSWESNHKGTFYNFDIPF